MITNLQKVLIKYREKRIYRITVRHTNGFSTGSGFFIAEKRFLTCFHVAFTKELRKLRNDPQFITAISANEHINLLAFYNNVIIKVEVELADGTKAPATLKYFNEKYDIALFEVELAGRKIKTCKLEWKPRLNRGDYVFFGGFPLHHDYPLDQTPLAVQEGVISSFVETIIGGEKYKHLQINSINLGGNSGAPLFKKWGRKVIGIVNGNMNFGNDNVMIKNPADNQATPQSLRVPLSIAYATSIDILKENTKIFD